MEKVSFSFHYSPDKDVFISYAEGDQSGEYVRAEVAEKLLAERKELLFTLKKVLSVFCETDSNAEEQDAMYALACGVINKADK